MTFDPFIAEAATRPEEVLSAVQTLEPRNDLPTTAVYSSDAIRMGDIFDYPTNVAGEHVSEASAMRISAVWRCVQLLSGSMATLPKPIYRAKEGADRERRPKDALWKLLNLRPNPRWTAATFWEWLTGAMLLRGDGHAWIERVRPNYDIVALWPLHPDSITPRLRANGSVYYEVAQNDISPNVPRIIDGADMLHMPGFGFNGLCSLSTIRHGANTAISVAQSAERQAGSWLRSGGAQLYALETDNKLSPDQIKQLREAWVERYSNAANATKPIVLTEGLKANTISVSAEDAQLLESRRFQVEDIARAFGVPPFMIGSLEKSTAWGTGLEQMGRGYLIYSLQPHIDRFEQELTEKLLPSDTGEFVEFNVDGLYRADLQVRSESYQKSLGGNNSPGWMTVNEIRARENLPAVDGGDELHRGPSGDQQNLPFSEGQE